MDPIVLNVLWNRLISTVNEQAAALMRSSFSSIVREAGDLAAGVFDRRGRMVAQATTGTPGHINPMATCMHHFLARFPIDELEPGDVLITNDPWKTASQLNDITIATPVFRQGRPIAVFANCCHALDIGGRGLSADSLSVFEEGIFIPVMKLYDRGAVVAPLMEMIEANVRTPDEVVGDIHSQMIANAVGGRQLSAFLDEFELDDIEALSDEIIDRSERAMRERIKALPDGMYPSEMTIDGYDEPIVISTRVIVGGDRLTVDFTGTSPTVGRGINVALNYTRGYTTYGIKCAISPDVPNNAGSFRPVHVTAPEGSILNAKYPVAVAGRHLVGHFLPSAVMGALAGALPDKVIAPGADALWDTHIAGEGPDGRYFSFTWFSCGGTGALARKDGLNATAFPSGIAGVPVEVIETLSPVVVRRRELRQDSGGAGTFRGGLGQIMEFGVRTEKPYQFAGLYERIDFPPPPLAGGEPGEAGHLRTNNQAPLRAKETTMLPPDTVVTIEIPGGGGYGSPLQRAPEAVLADVRDGYVTIEAARERYGVVIDSTSWAIDDAATRARRTRP
jgi:N-methylhydantoinase B